MHATQARPRRQQRLDDEEPFVVSRGSDRRPEPYSRSHNHSSRAEPFGSSSTAPRSFTDTSSRSRRSEDWRVAETSYASSAHVVAHSRQDDFRDRPEGWNGRPAESSQVYSSSHSSTRREWAKRDDHGHKSNSYSESRTWGGTSRYEETSRKGSVNDEWPREDTRHDRGRERLSREETFIGHDRDLRTRENLAIVDPIRDRRSSNWVERSNEHWRKEDRPRDREKEPSTLQGHSLPTDGVNRQWEPAAAWKSGERVDIIPARYERSDTLPPPRYSKKATKNRKKAQLAMQKRDAKRDDNMNNWHRREYQSMYKDRDISKPAFGKRRHELSPGSRSRSPARSIYSRRSSNRSRSRSLSPKRRKRGDEPGAHANFIPATKKNHTRRSRSPDWYTGSLTKSRRADESKARPRRTSISSRSSQSRSRSRSSSETPDTRPKPKHRLPTATSLRDIEMQAKSLRLSANVPAQQSVDLNNGSLVKRVNKSEQQLPASPNGNHREGHKPQVSNQYEDMPPPIIPASASEPLNNTSSRMHSSTVVVGTSPTSSKRNAGFKPIGAVRSSPAIKRFFPGDEDESSTSSGATQAKYHQDEQDEQDSPQPDNQREIGISSHQHRKDWEAPTYHRNSAIDVHRQREGRSKPEPARGGQHEETLGMHRRQPARASGVDVNGESSTKPNSRLGQLPLDKSKQVQVPSPKVDNHVNGRVLRKVSTSLGRPSETPSAMGSSHPSPAGPQAESAQATPMDTPRDQVYAIVSQVGEGTFGKVYKARNNITGVHVALKRIRMETERDGFPVTAMREIKLLQSIRHVNIVQLMEMMVHHGSVYMVFEYMDHDLTGVLSQTQFSFTDAHLKSLCKQMLQGLSYLHRKGVIHRDIKGSNILLNNRGELKLADFGLARFYQKRRRADYTNRVITLWYRPPELILGTTVYGPEVDMWSAGCIMLELFCKKPVFQGNDEIHQLDVIYKILGTPTPEDWPGVTDMPWYELVKPRETLRNRFRELFNRWLSSAALDLAERLLSYDPAQRATADQALEAAYFSQEPAPVLPVGLASLEGEWHELDSKRERAKKRRRVDPAAEPGSADISSQ